MAVERMQEGAAGTTKKAGDMASQAGRNIQDTASRIGEQAQSALSGAKDKVEDTLSVMGQRMTSLADTIRQQAPHEGFLGTTASTVAENLRAGGQYLQRHQVNDMLNDVTSLMRRYPVQSFLAGVGVGFLLFGRGRR
jgi:hypothetical protein